MQYLLLIFAVIINHSYAERRYVIDNDSDLAEYTAYPLDVCFKNKVQDAIWLKYTCNQVGDEVTKTVYSEQTCTTPLTPTPTTPAPITWPSSEPGACPTQPKFSCTGDDEYAMTGVYANSPTCASLATELPAALGCYCNSPTSSYTAECTSSSSGTITKWNTDTTCLSSTNTPQSLDTCYLAYTYANIIPISAKITDCVLAPSPGGNGTPAPSISSSPPTENTEPTPGPTRLPTPGPNTPEPTPSPADPPST
eukprot:1006923_1